jgi:hypothetical protein
MMGEGTEGANQTTPSPNQYEATGKKVKRTLTVVEFTDGTRLLDGHYVDGKGIPLLDIADMFAAASRFVDRELTAMRTLEMVREEGNRVVRANMVPPVTTPGGLIVGR